MVNLLNLFFDYYEQIKDLEDPLSKTVHSNCDFQQLIYSIKIRVVLYIDLKEILKLKVFFFFYL